jgi:hypothetical protein
VPDCWVAFVVIVLNASATLSWIYVMRRRYLPSVRRFAALAQTSRVPHAQLMLWRGLINRRLSIPPNTLAKKRVGINARLATWFGLDSVRVALRQRCYGGFSPYLKLRPGRKMVVPIFLAAKAQRASWASASSTFRWAPRPPARKPARHGISAAVVRIMDRPGPRTAPRKKEMLITIIADPPARIGNRAQVGGQVWSFAEQRRRARKA